jgi:hypothetical protein
MFHFVCNQCNVVDLTDLNYPCLPSQHAEQLCCQCRTGVWHGQFEREMYDPEKHMVINRDNQGLSLG